MFASRLLTALAIGVAACANPTEPTISGDWGGPDASLSLALSGGSVKYACGAGTIAKGWTLNGGGQWNATGEHRFGGGPAPIEGHPLYPASYTGTVQGSRLTFTVTLTDLPEVLGPFTLERGKALVLNQCV